MSKQPEALRLADAWDAAISTRRHVAIGCEMSDELRRLHAENDALKAELAKSRTPLTDSEWLEYILRNGSKSDVHIATYDGVATTGAHGIVIRLQHDANNLRKLVESAHGIQA